MARESTLGRRGSLPLYCVVSKKTTLGRVVNGKGIHAREERGLAPPTAMGKEKRDPLCDPLCDYWSPIGHMRGTFSVSGRLEFDIIRSCGYKGVAYLHILHVGL
jgi:hypothetical protein